MRRQATALLLSTVLLSSIAIAQSRRMMLVEEATNASCGPCAAQNPFFEYYLSLPHNEDDVIPIVFHANFPGSDVMNAANTSMHNQRVAYYGINGVPTVVVNGRVPTVVNGGYDGAPSDTAAIHATMEPVRGKLSPITMNVAETRIDDSSAVSITISSAEALDGATLRAYVVERHHNYSAAGSNGEKDFYYIARQSLPGNTGSALTLAANESKTFTMGYKMASAWNADEMYVVAFVQKNSGKEVLQAATSRITVDVRKNAPWAVRSTSEPAPFTWNCNVLANGPTTLNVTLVEAKLPSGWSSEVNVGSSKLSKVGDRAPVPTETGHMLVTITPGVTGVGRVTLRFEGTGGASTERTFKLYAGDIKVLMLPRDEGQPAITTEYEEALASSPVPAVTVDPGDESLFRLNDYLLVVEVGKAVLDRPTIEMLRSYIYDGGRLLLAGAEIAWGLADASATGVERDVAFLNNDLHADYVSDDIAATSIKGVAGDPIGDGLSFSFVDGVKNQDTPDGLAPRDGAVPILTYSTTASQVAGIRYADSKRRLVYLGFGLEGIGNTAKRSELMNKSISWLMSSETTASAPAESGSTAQGVAIHPNPTTGRFRLDLPASATDASVRLYDATGRLVSVLHDGPLAGRSAIEGDAADLVDGVYTVVVTAGGSTHAEKMVVVR